MNWIPDYLLSGLSSTTSSLPQAVFRVAVALAALIKFTGEHLRGGWHFLRPDRYPGDAYRRRRRGPAVGVRGYRLLYVMKFLAAGLLLAGVLPRLAALLLAVWFFFELTYDAENHTTLLAMGALLLAVSEGAGECLTWRTAVGVVTDGAAATLSREADRRSDPFAALLVVLLITQMYWSTAYRKIRSPEFRSGRVLHRVTEHLVLVGRDLPHKQSWYPAWAVRMLVLGDHETMRRRWVAPALATIVVEFALPIGLAVPGWWPWFALLGLGMHVAFDLLLPLRLAPFGLAAVGAYGLFASPLMTT